MSDSVASLPEVILVGRRMLGYSPFFRMRVGDEFISEG